MLVVQKSGPIDSPINFRLFGAMFEFNGTFEAGAESPDTIVIIHNTTDNNIALEPDLVFNVLLEIIPPDPQIELSIRETVVTIFDDDGRYMCIYVHILMRDERRKEERSKQGQTNNKAKQQSIPKAVTFPKKNEVNPRHSTL